MSRGSAPRPIWDSVLRPALLWALLMAVLSGCFGLEAPPRTFWIASTDGAITVQFPIDDRGLLGRPQEVSGTMAVDIEELGGPPCTDSATVYRFLALQIVDPDTGRQLHERDLLENPACHGDRFVWDGQDLVELEENEPWPDGLHLAYDTFEVASTAGPVTLTFWINDQRQLAIHYRVSGRRQVSLLELGSPPCTDTADSYESLTMRIVDADGDVLHEHDLLKEPACTDDRFVWDGQDLIELEQDDPWPDDLYRSQEIRPLIDD